MLLLFSGEDVVVSVQGERCRDAHTSVAKQHRPGDGKRRVRRDRRWRLVIRCRKPEAVNLNASYEVKPQCDCDVVYIHVSSFQLKGSLKNIFLLEILGILDKNQFMHDKCYFDKDAQSQNPSLTGHNQTKGCLQRGNKTHTEFRNKCMYVILGSAHSERNLPFS